MDAVPSARVVNELPNRHSLNVRVAIDDGRRSVLVSGELDFAGRDVVHGACVVDDSIDVTVDLGAATFLDCSGYSGLVAARNELESRGGSLMVRGATGQPARFLSLLSLLEGPRRVRVSGVHPRESDELKRTI